MEVKDTCIEKVQVLFLFSGILLHPVGLVDRVLGKRKLNGDSRTMHIFYFFYPLPFQLLSNYQCFILEEI